MKRLTLLASCAAVALTLGSAAYASDLNIGLVDVQKILASKNGMPKIQANLEHKFAGEITEIKTLLKKLQDEQKDFETNHASMSKTQIAKKEADFKAEQEKFQNKQASYQQAVMAAQNDEMKVLLDQVKDAAEKIAGKDDLDVVLVGNGVLYAKKAHDVTDKILDKMEK